MAEASKNDGGAMHMRRWRSSRSIGTSAMAHCWLVAAAAMAWLVMSGRKPKPSQDALAAPRAGAATDAAPHQRRDRRAQDKKTRPQGAVIVRQGQSTLADRASV